MKLLPILCVGALLVYPSSGRVHMLLASTWLPAEITSFSGSCQDGFIRFQWATRKERNTRMFQLEQSTDGYSWYKLGMVEAAGYSDKRISYRFVAPQNGGPYYRLVVVDRGGQRYVHPSIEVYCGKYPARVVPTQKEKSGELVIEVVPPQTSDQFELRARGLSDLHPARVEILDARGRLQVVVPLISEQGQWHRSFSAQLLQLPKGTYTIRLRQDGKIRKAQLVIRKNPDKQR